MVGTFTSKCIRKMKRSVGRLSVRRWCNWHTRYTCLVCSLTEGGPFQPQGLDLILGHTLSHSISVCVRTPDPKSNPTTRNLCFNPAPAPGLMSLSSQEQQHQHPASYCYLFSLPILIWTTPFHYRLRMWSYLLRAYLFPWKPSLLNLFLLRISISYLHSLSILCILRILSLLNLNILQIFLHFLFVRWIDAYFKFLCDLFYS